MVASKSLAKKWLAAVLLVQNAACVEICLQGCCGMALLLPSANTQLFAIDSEANLGKAIEKPSIDLHLVDNTIKCCPCNDDFVASGAESYENATLSVDSPPATTPLARHTNLTPPVPGEILTFTSCQCPNGHGGFFETTDCPCGKKMALAASVSSLAEHPLPSSSTEEFENTIDLKIRGTGGDPTIFKSCACPNGQGGFFITTACPCGGEAKSSLERAIPAPIPTLQEGKVDVEIMGPDGGSVISACVCDGHVTTQCPCNSKVDTDDHAKDEL